MLILQQLKLFQEGSFY